MATSRDFNRDDRPRGDRPSGDRPPRAGDGESAPSSRAETGRNSTVTSAAARSVPIPRARRVPIATMPVRRRDRPSGNSASESPMRRAMAKSVPTSRAGRVFVIAATGPAANENLVSVNLASGAPANERSATVRRGPGIGRSGNSAATRNSRAVHPTAAVVPGRIAAIADRVRISATVRPVAIPSRGRSGERTPTARNALRVRLAMARVISTGRNLIARNSIAPARGAKTVRSSTVRARHARTEISSGRVNGPKAAPTGRKHPRSDSRARRPVRRSSAP